MPSHLSNFCCITMGQSPKGDECNSSGIGHPLLNGPTEFQLIHPSPAQWTTNPKKFSKSGDLLFCVRGSTTGRMNWSDQVYAIGRGLASISPLHEDTIHFFRGAVEVHLPSLLAGATGSTFPNVSRSDLESIPIPHSDLKYIKSASSILRSLELKVELNQKINQTLEEIAKVIFKSWFVDFDPVRAKAAGRPTGLPPEISDLFPDELMNSEIGEIPRGWNVQPLSNQIKVNPKYTLKKGTDAYFVEMKCLSEATASIGEGYLRGFTSGSKFRRFDTLFARITPCLENGKTGLLLNSSASEVCWGSTEFIVLSPRDNQSPLFPYCWARHENLRTAAVSSMTGSSGRQRVPNDFFDRYLVADPDSSLHQTFAKVADPIMKRIQICEEEITTLTELRDTLLPKLISGELRIPDAEKFLEEAGI